MAAELFRLRQEQASKSRSPDDDEEVPSVSLPEPQNGIILDNDRLMTRWPGEPVLHTATLGPSTFSDEDIKQRFAVFCDRFHPCLPILSLPLPIAALQAYSPFLFWTIILVTTRYHKLPDAERDSFESHYTTLAQRASMTSPITLHTIQALLLICTWPVMARYQLAEPSYLYCSAAIGGAGLLNLSRPAGAYSYQGSQISDRDSQSMSRTWLGLLCVSSSLEIWYGSPRFFRHAVDLATMQSHIEQANVPPELAAEAALIAVVAKHESLVTSETDVDALDTLVGQHLAELNQLVHRYTMTLVSSDRIRFTALAMRMRLSASSVMAWKRTLKTFHDSRITGKVVAIIPIAQGIVETFNSLLHASQDIPAPARFQILPKSHYRIFIYATFFLLSFCCSNPCCGEQTRMESKQIISRAISILMDCSESSSGPVKGDEQGRGAECLKLLFNSADHWDENMQIDDRGESSIVWNTLRRAYRLRGRSTNRTDLLDYIDPTNAARRNSKHPGESDRLATSMNTGVSDSTSFDDFDEQSFLEAFQEVSEFDWVWQQGDFNAVGFV